MLRFIVPFLIFCNQSIAVLAQSGMDNLWDTVASVPIRAIVRLSNGQWLLSGYSKDGHIHLTTFDDRNRQLGPSKDYFMTGNPQVNAMYPDSTGGCMMVGSVVLNGNQVPWMAYFNGKSFSAPITIPGTTLSGVFYDVIKSAGQEWLVTGQREGHLTFGSWDGSIFTWRDSVVSAPSIGRTLLQMPHGEVLIAGEYHVGDNQFATLWQYQPGQKSLNCIWRKQNAKATAICRNYYGQVVVAGIASEKKGEKGWITCFEKQYNLPMGGGEWSAAQAHFIGDSPADTMTICSVLPLTDGSFLLAGSSDGYVRGANMSVPFIARWHPANIAGMTTRYWRTMPGGAAMALGRSERGTFLIAGFAQTMKKGKGWLATLNISELSAIVPILETPKGLPGIVFEDALRFDEPFFNHANEVFGVEGVKIDFNGQVEELGEQIRGMTAKPHLNIRSFPLENDCCEHRLSGSLLLKRGELNHFSLEGFQGKSHDEAQQHAIYCAPALYVVAVGNNYGDGEYFSPLKFAEKDAQDICDTLKAMEGWGFRKVETLFLDKKSIRGGGLERALQSFHARFDSIDGELVKLDGLMRKARLESLRDSLEHEIIRLKDIRLDKGDIFLFTISSHGTFIRGNLSFPSSVDEMIDFNSAILNNIDGLNCRKIIMMDACLEAKDGIKPHIPALPDVLIITSCEPGKRSSENDNIKNGLFTAAVLKALGTATGSLSNVATPLDICDFIRAYINPEKQIPQLYGGENIEHKPFLYRYPHLKP